MTNDRTKPERAHIDLPDGSLSDDLRSFLGDAPSESKPVPRTRQLRTSFRAVPTFPAHSSDGRPAGGSLESASPGTDGAPAPPARAKHFKGWRTPVLETRAASPAADKSVQPADASTTGGRVRGRGRGRSATNSAAVAAAEPGPAGRRGRPPGSGKKAKQAEASSKLPAAIQKLVPKSETRDAPRVIVPTETERSSATRLFREIGETFNKNRKKSKTAAYAAFRHDLMANLDTLIMGGAIDLKEATTIITNLEQYTKETEAESTETPATILGRWLRMDAAEVAGLSVETVEEAVEDEEIESDDDTEENTASEDQISGQQSI